ncbi:MAG: hypothetical protein K0R47_2622 [Brevibacillus sp.]|jgi:hypothetical protein|nr:hypothetical protein [Brevibacillus sp.]
MDISSVRQNRRKVAKLENFATYRVIENKLSESKTKKRPEGAYRYELVLAAATITGRGPVTITVVPAAASMVATATMATSALRFVNRLIVAVFFIVFLFTAFPNVTFAMRSTSASATH